MASISVFSVHNRREVRESYEEKLITDLFADYDSRSRPRLNSTESVQVRVKFVLVQLNNLEWQDERLTWDPKHYGGLRSVVVSSQMLWLPDIALQNSASEIYHSSFQDAKFRITVGNTGHVLWLPGGKFFTNCELDIQYFPFDDQTCKLHFTNWAYTGLQVNLLNASSKIPLENYKLNGEWDIVATKASREDVYFYCCPEVPYPSVYFTIFMRRKFLYHLTNIVTPCLMLSILVAVVFYLPPDDGEKIALGITVLLSFSVFLLLIAESMPRISESVPIISIYLSIFIGLTTVSIFWTVLVLNVHHRTIITPVPKWLRLLLFECLARMLCMHHVVPKADDQKNGAKRDSKYSEMGEDGENSHLMTPLDHVGARLSSQRISTGSNGIEGPIRCALHAPSFSVQKSKSPYVERSYFTRMLEEVVDHLRLMSKNRREEEEEEWQRSEWRAAACIIDRFFFLLSMAIILVSSVAVLLFIPLNKPDLKVT
ncbi:neuronal acetylcholine receptor subunit alpha-10-like [Lingula anatina]|uniref:Neuronal acetylcholine receptor subunit alpha-10-like n=1 Tax=Lingula anatina TaxID=7574 RepID=A0A1S3JM39_LINAN|nr:neuronal acetylcholine receptor subunit alpha-10-like [Lingula anatina]|eukprot:XP_013411442.1 neuronal acetylcholine receptor subunit alpha-10-like [Lingula anatina]